MVESENTGRQGLPVNVLPPSPPGLESLYLRCRRIYPDQPNPLQVAALVKYWLGGPDPLDYISMYSNPGNPQLNVPPHWHYISFGLSDLHGDGRVHESRGPGDSSGFGFELTLRLKQEEGETAPPTWPASLLQSLAKYVFHSGVKLCNGDHVSWHYSLDGSHSSLIRHMLLLEDPELGSVTTPCGTVTFVQVVGVTKDELSAAQKWNSIGVLDILASLPRGVGGGGWLVTNMRRQESMFDVDPSSRLRVERGIEADGSNLSGVTATCSWTSVSADGEETAPDARCGSEDEPAERRRLNAVHLTFNLESAALLPFALRGRVRHGRHFTFKCGLSRTVVTLVAEGVTGAFVSAQAPYTAHGAWLQVYIPHDFATCLAKTLQPLVTSPPQVALPKTYSWPHRRITITVVPDSAQLHQQL